MQDLRHWTAGDWFLLPQAETGLPGVIVGALARPRRSFVWSCWQPQVAGSIRGW